MRELFKAAFVHDSIAVIDVISPCVTFNNQDQAMQSYTWGRENESPIQDITFIPKAQEILVEDFQEGTYREVKLHDGSSLLLKKIDRDYDPTSKTAALDLLTESYEKRYLTTGLFYIEKTEQSIFDIFDLGKEPLNRLPAERIRPDLAALERINAALE